MYYLTYITIIKTKISCLLPCRTTLLYCVKVLAHTDVENYRRGNDKQQCTKHKVVVKMNKTSDTKMSDFVVYGRKERELSF